MLRPGETVTLFGTPAPALARRFQAAVANSRISIVYCYCSIFNACWKLDSRHDIHTPEPVSKCPDFDRNAYRN